jgi:hypothetical protein
MNKLSSLRSAIEAVLPALEIDPARLKIWVERGSVASPMTADFSFAMNLKTVVQVQGTVSEPIMIFIAILAWLRVNQPALLAPNRQAFLFDADILSNSAMDIDIDLELIQNVHVVSRDDGGFDMQYLDEPDPLFDDETPLSNPASDFVGAWLVSQGVVGAEKLLPDSPPLGADVQP